MRKILNIGSGNDNYGTHRMDIIKRPNVTHLGDAEKEFPFEDNYFDEVYAKQIFEHLGNPLKFLLECKRVLKKGGKLKIYTDNGNFLLYIFNRIKIVHGDYRYFGDKIDKKDMHFQFFQPEHIRNYFWRTGFNEESFKIELIKGANFKRHPLKQRVIRNILSFLFGKRLGRATIYAEARK